MDEQSRSIDLMPFAKQVQASMQKQQKVQSTLYENWLIDVFFGPVPTPDSDLPRIGYAACAQTQDIDAGPIPDVNASDGVRVDFDKRSVVWWTGESLDDLKNTITKAFPEMIWAEEDTNVE